MKKTSKLPAYKKGGKKKTDLPTYKCGGMKNKNKGAKNYAKKK